MKTLKSFLKLVLILTIAILKFAKRLFVKLIVKINSKKRYALPFYITVTYFLFVFFLIFFSGDDDYDYVLKNKRVTEITQINSIHTQQIVKPTQTEEIVKAIKNSTGTISIGGGRYSMGGQVAFENSLHLDMRNYNKVLHIDTIQQQVTVQTGITWRKLQEAIDKHNLSIKIMQTYANFTVGGSISVNCHGRYIGHGPIISSVKNLKIIDASGNIINANRAENYDVFKAAIGGYGGIGVITEATLQLVPNTKVARYVEKIKATNYNTYFDKKIKNDSSVVFQNGDLYPPKYETINSVYWKESNLKLTDTARLTDKCKNAIIGPKAIDFVSLGSFGHWTRRNIIEPYIYRNQEVVYRNNEASYDVAQLSPIAKGHRTYVLQEYFIPAKNIQSFIPKMRAVYKKHNVNVINVSLRHAFPDKESYLSWADEEVFAFVIYYKQNIDEKAKQKVKEWTVEMTDAILSENGKWYLPYQPHASIHQFKQAYPNAQKYFDLKNKLDPTHRFNNKLLDKYNPYLTNAFHRHKNNIKGYYRSEEQTFLTVPEWYLVFNPKEYADYLENGKNPSNFPYYASIDEYWKLYDRSQQLVSKAYPKNEEYNTMLKVIGVSITMEYAAKIIYENTIGRVFGWFANSKQSAQEKTIYKAQRAYSDFIYQTAWYEFKFSPWIQKVWSVKDHSNASFLRKWERTFFFTLEFSFKALYAQLIEWAATASYETPVEKIYLLGTTTDTIPQNQHIQIVKQKDHQKLVSIKRWGAFTQGIKTLINTNLVIDEIGGNDEIVVSTLQNKNANINFKKAKLLYKSKVVTSKKITRNVYVVPVTQLLLFVKQIEDANGEVEHIFDY